jgi:hypothetical protein
MSLMRKRKANQSKIKQLMLINDTCSSSSVSASLLFVFYCHPASIAPVAAFALELPYRP